MPYPIYHKNMSQIEFSTLAAKLRICLIFTGRHKQKTMESESKVNSAKVKQELNSRSGDGMSSPLHSLIESTSVLRRQFKITGQIRDPDQKDKLNYSSLRKQMETGVEQKYKRA